MILRCIRDLFLELIAKMRLFDVEQDSDSPKEEEYEYTESKLNKSFDGFTF